MVLNNLKVSLKAAMILLLGTYLVACSTDNDFESIKRAESHVLMLAIGANQHKVFSRLNDYSWLDENMETLLSNEIIPGSMLKREEFTGKAKILMVWGGDVRLYGDKGSNHQLGVIEYPVPKRHCFALVKGITEANAWKERVLRVGFKDGDALLLTEGERESAGKEFNKESLSADIKSFCNILSPEMKPVPLKFYFK